MAPTLDFAFFESHVGQTFQVDGAGVELKLDECNRLKPVEGQPREPFSLVFRGPATPILQQQTYALTNALAGRVEIFLVPVARDAAGLQYEAVFN